MNEQPLKILGIAGSLRQGSFNRRLLDHACRQSTPAVAIDALDIASVPLYDADIDTDAQRPAAVRRLKDAIAASDGVLFATPEYNHGVPGVMQNAIDWASRPAFKSPFVGKPVAMMGASGGAGGTMRGQQALKLVLLSMLAEVFPHPGVAVPYAKDKFDTDGQLVHEATRDFVNAFLRDFEAWVRRRFNEGSS
ncbi:MAG TPA: NADPH-dependent FMN reductase [Casimicrobiaceae bacterium]|nr:NADPH-dependent FMN reductase [Casimicrobiaceae bacterium]